ncbi:hypothetical protein CEY00_Acc06082 [Actinidia chinensis var. chinensis]|uniref:Protein kinase domain-containing protein n=1 Tax=Actinidia chinensis var. chinensis TaxID=1590841 RepID=A0A2R6RL98_ACTCC|nr:hypothetical protein CEY00_Acc06082 [Actinidia chinensis var. chinensis]
MKGFFLCFFTTLAFLTSGLRAQQVYSGNDAIDCGNTDETGPNSALLYSCNGERHSCKAFLIFRSQFPYDSVPTISNLTSSDPQELAHINNISNSSPFPPDQEVIVPVCCSCSGWYYQANASYVTSTTNNTYFTIANNTYQGLSTCNILMRENVYGELDLGFTSLRLKVPLRCACPTRNQTANGTRFLVTYVVTWHDSIPKVSKRFNASAISVAHANGFSEEDPMLFPFTTILIPFANPPLSSQIIIPDPPAVSPPLSPIPRNRKMRKGLCVGIGTGLSVIVLCFVLFVGFYCYKRRKLHEANGKEAKNKLQPSKDLLRRIASVDHALKVYEFGEIQAATENFSHQRRLSDSVHRGVLRGKFVVIKRMRTDVSKEIQILKKTNHSNLITLYGACEHHGVFYLIYEYMENGSLKDWLQRETCQELQSWNYRLQIALDVANGLHYLHNFTDPAYVHRDINSSNVLLSTDLRAKIANFSLARSAEQGQNGYSPARCALVMRGYVAPEYLEAGLVTPMMDVYAFGVVLLELITGKGAVFQKDGVELLLLEEVMSIMDGGNEDSEFQCLIDPRLRVKHPLGYIIDQSELALRMMKLSVACLAQEPASRVCMSKVVSTLRRIQLDASKFEY